MIKNILNWLQRNIILVAIFCMVVFASILRIQLYGDVKLSIAGNDTASYVDASQVPLFSSEIFTGRRLFTTNLIYKIFQPENGYEILVNGSIETTRRIIQPGLIGIVILQLALSVFGWGMLALVISEYIKNSLMKIISAGAILLFAFTPQTADWDSILMSESLTFSLFALEFAILIKLAFLLYNNPNQNVTKWMIGWAIVYFFWTFIKDTNLFVSIVTIALIALLLFWVKYRTNKNLWRALIFLALVFIFGIVTSANSTRSQVQLINIYQDDLLSSPLRTQILKDMGMPEPYTSEYNEWFEENSTKALIKFMLTHPGYPMTKVINDFPWAFTEIKQTYFKAPELNPARETLMTIGDALHPENTTPFLMSLLLLIGIIYLGFNNIHNSLPWAWLGVWLYLIASITLIPTILGDTWALNRHALFSTMLYRFCMWLFAIIIIDIALAKNTPLENKKP
ncbi:MAG: hypothetical protein HC797_08440 [Anaerolineales bacterium]|nr:hypothetical protein [Anaerolineales bacterium]